MALSGTALDDGVCQRWYFRMEVAPEAAGGTGVLICVTHWSVKKRCVLKGVPPLLLVRSPLEFA